MQCALLFQSCLLTVGEDPHVGLAYSTVYVRRSESHQNDAGEWVQLGRGTALQLVVGVEGVSRDCSKTRDRVETLDRCILYQPIPWTVLSVRLD